MIELKNEYLSVVIAEMGAELQSVKDTNGNEYIWQADPDYWPRHAPVLFPIVCSVEGDTYYVDGKEYHLPRHGFARDTMFEVVSQDEKSVTLMLTDNEETLKDYPFNFILGITYILEGIHLSVVWHVENTGVEEMHFQIGGHPAFNVPGMKKGDKLEGRLQLDCKEPMVGLKSYIDGSHEMTEIDIDAEEGLIKFDDEYFANDSVKIHDSQTSSVSLLDKNGHNWVRMDYQAPVIAFWSPYQKNAPFVCIEPWYGLGDPRGYKGEFKDKPLMNHLLQGAMFVAEYDLTFGE